MTSKGKTIDNSSTSNNAADTSDPFARLLMSRYLLRRRSDLDMLAQALVEKDFEAIQLSGHRLYGSGAAYGFQQITEIGEGLEKAAAAKQVDDIRALIADLEKFVFGLDIA